MEHGYVLVSELRSDSEGWWSQMPSILSCIFHEETTCHYQWLGRLGNHSTYPLNWWGFSLPSPNVTCRGEVFALAVIFTHFPDLLRPIFKTFRICRKEKKGFIDMFIGKIDLKGEKNTQKHFFQSGLILSNFTLCIKTENVVDIRVEWGEGVVRAVRSLQTGKPQQSPSLQACFIVRYISIISPQVHDKSIIIRSCCVRPVWLGNAGCKATFMCQLVDHSMSEESLASIRPSIYSWAENCIML